jgi:hypothetical protein
VAVLIPIITQYAGKGVERALKEFQSLGTASDKAAFLMKKALVPGAIAATGAIVGLGATLFKAAQAAAEAEREDKLLADQLRRTTGATDQAIAATLQFVDALEMESTVSGGELSQALATLTRATGNVTTAQEQLRLATDISVGANLDLQAVSLALAKAYGGNMGALTKLGVPLDENIVKTKDFEAATAALSKQFGGAAAGAADTFQGQLARLKIGFDKLVEAVGEVVLPYLERFVAMLNKHVVPALRIFVDQLRGGKGVAGSFEVAIASMGDFAPVAIRAMRAATEAVLEFVKTIALAYAGIQTLIGAAQALATRGKAGLPAFGAALAAAGGAVITDQLKNRTLGYFDDLESRLGSLSTQANAARSALNPIPDRLDRISAAALALAGGDGEEEGGGGGGGASSGLNKMAERAKKLQERLEAAAKALRDDMANALQIAEERLQEAQQAFDEFADSVTSTIKDSLDFGDALEASAEEGGTSFFDELTSQANRAEEFGKLTEELLRRDISKDALNQVIAAGVESGAEIARQLLASADGVLRANELVARTQAIAEKIGQASAAKFYDAGVENGKAYLKGVMEAIAEAERRIAGAKRPADIKGAGAAFSDTIGRLNNSGSTVQNVTINSQSLDPSQAGQVIVDALREYNQRSGYVGLNATPF